MRFSFPGDHLHLENHGVSEENFWPSFTDIMMVIVMVFLLITVAVILNNWTLISNLKESIRAQEEASHLAEDKEVENIGLEAKLNYLEKQLILANENTESEQKKLAEALSELSQSQTLVSELNAISKEQKVLLAESEKSLHSVQQVLEQKEQLLSQKEHSIAALHQQLDNSQEKTGKLEKLTAEQKMQLAGLTKSRDKLKSQLKQKDADLLVLKKEQVARKDDVKRLQDEARQKMQALSLLQTDRGSLEDKLGQLQKRLVQANAALESNKITSNDVKAELSRFKTEKKEQDEALQRLEEEKQRVIVALNKKVSDYQKQLDKLKNKLDKAESKVADSTSQLKKMDKLVIDLQKRRKTGEAQLLSLKGEYNVLDNKYQKLLRPARSSKGKHVVTVVYRKMSGKKTIRLKLGPNTDLKTVKKNAMHNTLLKLKKKYKNDLYVKIIIPKNSGLSYNEAWRFTSDLQKKYDYYYQNDKSIKSESSVKKSVTSTSSTIKDKAGDSKKPEQSKEKK